MRGRRRGPRTRERGGRRGLVRLAEIGEGGGGRVEGGEARVRRADCAVRRGAEPRARLGRAFVVERVQVDRGRARRRHDGGHWGTRVGVALAIKSGIDLAVRSRHGVGGSCASLVDENDVRWLFPIRIPIHVSRYWIHALVWAVLVV